eukprot:6770949-Prymnesium_polylepis.1
MAAFVDARVAHSFESLAGACCSPLPLRAHALRQARLPSAWVVRVSPTLPCLRPLRTSHRAYRLRGSSQT